MRVLQHILRAIWLLFQNLTIPFAALLVGQGQWQIAVVLIILHALISYAVESHRSAKDD